MTKTEKAAVVRIVRHMQSLQRQISKPTHDDATEEEIHTIIRLLWKWTPIPNQHLPSKHKLEKLVGLFRGCEPREIGYISGKDVARIIRKASQQTDHTGDNLYVVLDSHSLDMTDDQLYYEGRWNYRETPIAQLLTSLHCNPQDFGPDGETW